MQNDETNNGKSLAQYFRVFGWLEIVGGIICTVVFLPGDAGSGYTWKPVAYSSSITWLIVGIVSGMLFFAIAYALESLSSIENHVKVIKQNIEISVKVEKENKNNLPIVEISHNERNVYTIEEEQKLEKLINDIGYTIEYDNNKWIIKKNGNNEYATFAYSKEQLYRSLKEIIEYEKSSHK